MGNRFDDESFEAAAGNPIYAIPEGRMGSNVSEVYIQTGRLTANDRLLYYRADRVTLTRLGEIAEHKFTQLAHLVDEFGIQAADRYLR